MNKVELLVINTIKELNKGTTQRELSSSLGLSISNINTTINNMKRKGLLNDNNCLNDYKLMDFATKSAVILAAGIGLRMLPINSDLPKALLTVNGEVLVERLIKQLKEKDIKNINVVVGYQKEKFEYLIDKYGINLIVNSKYGEDNNCYSLYLARNNCSNCYIVPGDLYFKTNPFNYFEDKSYYVFSDEASKFDYFSLDSKHRIVKRKVDDNREHFKAVGLAYICKDDFDCCVHLLEKIVSFQNNTYSYWEDILLIKNGLKIRPTFINSNSYQEINTFEDLRKIDPKSQDLNNKYIHIIEGVFHTSIENINDVVILKKGMTNRSFLFTCDNEKYIMRIPGEGTSKLIRRQNEYESYQAIIKYNISDEVLYMNPLDGVKITRFIKDAHNCNPNNKEEVSCCIRFLKKFHDLELKCNHDFDVYGQIEWYEKLRGEASLYPDYEMVKRNVLSLKPFIGSMVKKKCLCHIDSVPDNFLIDLNGNIRLIDWEYSGMNDPHLDIAMFAIYSGYDKKMIDFLIDTYFDGKCDAFTKYKIYAYVAAAGLLWSNWCEYKHTLGVEFGEYSIRQYRYGKEYSKLVLDFLKGKSEDES